MDHRTRDATRSDLDAIREIAEVTWKATYSGLLSDDEITGFVAEHYEPSLVAQQIELAATGQTSHFLVAEVDGEVAGYLHWEVMPDRGPYLRRLYVLPPHQGTGLGMALITDLHRRLGEGAVYELDVHPENGPAIEFYFRLGAEWTGRRIEPYWDLMRIEVSAGTSNPYPQPARPH
jgi:ribosomal protein S18 acetylase RimI-like enzyme